MSEGSMTDDDRWRGILRRAVFVGSVASVVSTLMVSRRSALDSGTPASGTNSTSHWLWGERAHHRRDVTLRYTGVGFVIHHLCSIFWGAVYERWFVDPKDVFSRMAGKAVAVSALAAAADYLVTPKRLTPGFERHLTLRSMVLVYVTFAGGLAMARSLIDAPSQRPD